MVRPDQSARWWAAVGVVLFVVVFGGFFYLLNRPEWEEQAIVAIEGASDSSQLLVTVVHEDCSGRRPKVHADEDSRDTVVVRARYDVHGDCEDIALATLVEVELDAPLGDRTILADRRNNELDCTIDGEPSDRCR